MHFTNSLNSLAASTVSSAGVDDEVFEEIVVGGEEADERVFFRGVTGAAFVFAFAFAADFAFCSLPWPARAILQSVFLSGSLDKLWARALGSHSALEAKRLWR